MPVLPSPDPGVDAAVDFVATHLGHLVSGAVAASPAFRGGQAAADARLAGFDVGGYARQRNEVAPVSRRGASTLSPYIRHGLLTLPATWRHVAGGPSRDVKKFRDELLWQEYARHWYARLGGATRHGVRRTLAGRSVDDAPASALACIAEVAHELETDGWLVNQTRMWFASHWAVRHGLRWQDGEDHFFTHLLDGSRAANRLGWQWTTGVGSSKPYGFSRWQVEKRAPALCASCALRDNCPISAWPDDPVYADRPAPDLVRHDPDPERTGGPAEPTGDAPATAVWLTAESLGDDDPASIAHPELPAVFVFDEPLLDRLRLSAKRLVFLVETLAEIAQHRTLEIRLGDPAIELADRALAVTFAPVPGFRTRAQAVGPAEVHPWPWLVQPHAKSIASFSAWRRAAGA